MSCDQDDSDYDSDYSEFDGMGGGKKQLKVSTHH